MAGSTVPGDVTGLRPNPIAPDDQGRLRELAQEFGIPEHADRLVAMAQNGVLLRPASDGDEPRLERTRTAGSLSLPVDFRWPHLHQTPMYDDGELRPRGSLVCQCDWSVGFPPETDAYGRLVHRDRLPEFTQW